MKKIINRNINIITSSLIIIIFVLSSLFSYKKQTKAQEEFVENSLSFLTYKKIDKNKLDNFKKSYNVDLLLKDTEGKILYNSGLNKNIIKNYEFDDVDIVKKSKNNYKGKKINIFAKKSNDKILAIEFSNQTIIFYILKRIYILIFEIIFALIINKFFTNHLYERITNPFKERIDDKKEFYHFKENPKDYIENLRFEKKNVEEENSNLKARILDIEKVSSNMEEGFIYFDKDGNILIINKAAKELLNIKKDKKLENLVENDAYKLAIKETKLLKKGKNIV